MRVQTAPRRDSVLFDRKNTMASDDDPMTYLHAQREKLALMSQAAEAASQQQQFASQLGAKMARLDSMTADALNASAITELTSSEREALQNKSAGMSNAMEKMPQPCSRSELTLCTKCFDCPCACKK